MLSLSDFIRMFSKLNADTAYQFPVIGSHVVRRECGLLQRASWTCIEIAWFDNDQPSSKLKSMTLILPQKLSWFEIFCFLINFQAGAHCQSYNRFDTRWEPLSTVMTACSQCYQVTRIFPTRDTNAVQANLPHTTRFLGVENVIEIIEDLINVAALYRILIPGKPIRQ